MRSPVELARETLATGYILDASGRILAINDGERSPARRFAMIRTAEGNAWAIRSDMNETTATELEALACAEPPCADPERQSPRMLAAALRLLGLEDADTSRWRGPGFVFNEPPQSLAIDAPIIEEPRDGTFPFHPDLHALDATDAGPSMVALVDGVAVSRCFSSRLTPSAAEAGLRTAEPFRGRGYGPAVTAAWASRVIAGGRTAFYSTEWPNAASRAVARKLVARYFGEHFHIP